MLMALILQAFNVRAFSDAAAGEKEYFCWTGAGIYTGNVTYQIGGHFVVPSRHIDEVDPFPLSKLQFPLNVTMVTFGNEFTFNKNFEIRGEITKNISTGAGQEMDTDYIWMPGPVVQTYSASDADVQAITTDVGFRYWVARQNTDELHLKLGLGFAYLYEHFEWRLSNLDQFDYYYSSGFPYVPTLETVQSGLIGTYETTTNMPYLEVASEFEQTDAFSLLISLGYSPIAQISDEDNHILRQIVSTTNVIGSAYKIGVQAKYNLSKNWILMGKWDWINYDLTGTENDLVYGGADTGVTFTEGHEISSTQSIFTLSLATKF